jgi:hypothetical protein
MRYIANAFSLQMVPADLLSLVRMRPGVRPNVHTCTSVVGHADTAAVLGVPMNRASVTLDVGDVVYVAQLKGGRLPEGATTLPEGATTLPEGAHFEWVRVEIVDPATQWD